MRWRGIFRDGIGGAVDAFVGGEGAKGVEMGDRVERGPDGTGVVKPVTDLENMSGVVLTK